MSHIAKSDLDLETLSLLSCSLNCCCTVLVMWQHTVTWLALKSWSAGAMGVILDLYGCLGQYFMSSDIHIKAESRVCQQNMEL